MAKLVRKKLKLVESNQGGEALEKIVGVGFPMVPKEKFLEAFEQERPETADLYFASQRDRAKTKRYGGK